MTSRLTGKLSLWLREQKFPRLVDVSGGKKSPLAEAGTKSGPKPGALKNLFIPHQGNNYAPRILHPKRVAFHAASAVAVKLILIAFVYLMPISAWLAPDTAGAQGEKIINLTNRLRQQAGVNLLDESRLLDYAAESKAQDMLTKEYFAHLNPEGRGLAFWLAQAKYDFAVAGENLAMGFSTPEETVTAWQNSPTHMKNLVDKDFSEIGVGFSAGSYKNSDTTFVAQYFGAPRRAKPAAAAVAAGEPATAMVLERTARIGVLGNKAPAVAPPKTAALSAPVIISPAASAVTNKAEINFVLSHPGASSFELFLNGQRKVAADNLTADTSYLVLTLPEGVYHAQAIARNGKYTASSSAIDLTIDKTAPALDLADSRIKLLKGGSETTLEITARLSEDTASAQADFWGNTITLYRDKNRADRWLGYGVLSSEKSSGATEVPAVIRARDLAGNDAVLNLPLPAVRTAPASVIGHYSFLRANQTPLVQAMFDFTSGYYKLLLALAGLALVLNIFIEIKKQHHHLIGSTVGLIALLILLIMV